MTILGTSGDDNLTGNLEIHDFVLRDEPAIRSLVARSETVSQPGQDAAAARAPQVGRQRRNFGAQTL